MKRFIALLSFLSFLILPSAQAYSSWDTDWYWSDYYSEIEWMVNNGVMVGDGDGNFRPDDCVNRAEILKVMYTMKGGMVKAERSFGDVEEGEWYEPYVSAAALDGYVEGYEDGSFRPGQCVTRAEAVKIAVEAFGSDLPAPDPLYDYFLDYYLDVNEGDWFYDPLSWALNIQVVGEAHVEWDENYEFGYFYPNEAMTREEVAALFYRIQGVIDNDASYYDYWVAPLPLGEIFTSSCTIDRSNVVHDVPLEWGLHEAAEVIARLDGTNQGQLKQFVSHVNELSAGEAWDALIEAYDFSMPDELAYEDFAEQILTDDWQVGMSVVMDEGVGIAVSVDQFNEFQAVIADALWREYGMNVVCEAAEEFTLWTVEWDDLYAFRYGDLFTFSTSESMRQALMSQVFAGEGADEITADALLYAWMDIAAMEDEIGDLLAGSSLDISEMDELEFTVKAKDDGFYLTSDLSFVGDNSQILDTYEDQSLTLINQVPQGDALLFYYEDQDLSFALDALMEAFFYQEDPYLALSDLTGFDSQTLQYLAESGYALSVSDSGGTVPNVAFYLELTRRDEKALAPELTSELDDWLATQFESDPLMVRDESVTGEVHKWVSSSELMGDKLEFYYGLVEDDVYVIALYDDFLNAWGGTAVEDNRRMGLVADHLSQHNPARVQFIDFQMMHNWMSDVASYHIEDYDYRNYNEAAAWLERLGRIYSTSYVTSDSVLRQELFWEL